MATNPPASAKSIATMGKYSDVMLVMAVLLVVALMVLRLPTAMIDALVGINIAIGIGLLLIAIYIPAPVAFNTFPSVLLVTTLFRLSLSVATTRLILLEADAGKIIDAFGRFVAGGNLVVGIVVFIIITVVQFIVIAKGAERVAEVAARFTLDAMPGKQMSIDSDLRSGLITQEEARAKRSLLEKESQLNGALDGAMKFVKGDAIAGIIIVLVNLIGGLTIGMLQHDMAAGEAMQIYSILTIGDGMVAQIPALLGTMAAGLVVTRTTGENDDSHLGEAISRQLTGQPRALMVTGLTSLLLSLVPGFPTLVFLGLAAALLSICYVADPNMFAWFRGRPVASSTTIMEGAPEIDNPQLQVAQPLVIEFDRQVANILTDSLRRRMFEMQYRVGNELGIVIPSLHYLPNPNLPGNSYRITVFDVPAAGGNVEQGMQAMSSTAADDWLLDLMESILRRHAGEFLGIQEINNLLEKSSQQYGALIKEVLRVVSVQCIAEIFRNLVAEGLPIRNIRDIFEALVEWGGKEKDPAALTEFVRIGLKRYITSRYVQADRSLPAFVLQPAVEDQIRKANLSSAAGNLSGLAPDAINVLTKNLHALREAAAQSLSDSGEILLVAIDVRRHVKKIIENEFPGITVLSYQELVMPVNIVSLGQLSLDAIAQERVA